MLQRASKSVADCHRRANECVDKAARASNPEDQLFYLDMADRWLFLARSYEFTERSSAVSNELDRRTKGRE